MELSYSFPMHHIHNSESRKRAVEDHSIFGNGTVIFFFLYTLRLQLIAGTNFSVFALRDFGIY